MRSHVSRGSSRLRNFVGLFAPLLALSAQVGSAQVGDPTVTGGIGSITRTEGGYTLTFVSETDTLTAETAANLQSTFFSVYPQECSTFSTGCATSVTIRVEPTDIDCGTSPNAAACATGPLIQISGPHIATYPEDYDIVAHEAMHVVQADYVSSTECWYWSEGIADVARSRFGLDQTGQSWRLEPAADKTYQDGYGPTAHFLEWIKTSYMQDVTVELDAQLRSNGCPTDEFWEALTTFGVDQLWEQYLAELEPTSSAVASTTAPTVPDETIVSPDATGDGGLIDPGGEGGLSDGTGTWGTGEDDSAWETGEDDSAWETGEDDSAWETGEDDSAWETGEDDGTWETGEDQP